MRQLKEANGATKTQTKIDSIVGAHGTLETGDGRRLSSSSTYMSPEARHVVHEFPNGVCNAGSAGNFMRVRPTKVNGEISWEPSPTDVTADVALVAVDDSWGTTNIDSFAAPLKIVHDSNCSTSPTLELPLNTRADGSLSIGSVNVGSLLNALQRPYWTQYQQRTNALLKSTSADVNSVVLIGATLGGDNIISTSLSDIAHAYAVEATAAAGISGFDASSTTSKFWFLVAEAYGSSSSVNTLYSKVILVEVTSNGGQLFCSAVSGGYKIIANMPGNGLYDINSQWSGYVSQTINDDNEDSGYVILQVQYLVL